MRSRSAWATLRVSGQVACGETLFRKQRHIVLTFCGGLQYQRQISHVQLGFVLEHRCGLLSLEFCQEVLREILLVEETPRWGIWDLAFPRVRWRIPSFWNKLSLPSSAVSHALRVGTSTVSRCKGSPVDNAWVSLMGINVSLGKGRARGHSRGPPSDHQAWPFVMVSHLSPIPCPPPSLCSKGQLCSERNFMRNHNQLESGLGCSSAVECLSRVHNARSLTLTSFRRK